MAMSNTERGRRSKERKREQLAAAALGVDMFTLRPSIEFQPADVRALIESAPEAPCEPVPVESAPEAPCESVPVESAPEAPCEPVPVESAPEAPCEPVPVESAPEAPCESVPVESAPEAPCEPVPVESAPEAPCEPVPVESAPEAPCEPVPVESAPEAPCEPVPVESAPEAPCEPVPVESAPEAPCEPVPVESAPEAPCEPVPVESAPEAPCEPVPVESAPEAPCEPVPVESAPEAPCEPVPVESAPEAPCESVPVESAPEAPCESVPVPFQLVSTSVPASVEPASAPFVQTPVPFEIAPIGDPDTPDVPGLIDWIGKLKVTQGRRAGEPFEILNWQAEFLECSLANRVFDSALSMARGNGKSTFSAAVLCACLIGPLRQPRGEVVLVASSFAQARVVYEHVIHFMQPIIETDPSVWRVEDNSQRAAITHRPTGSRVRCIASDPKRAHGLAPSFAILDEPAQWPTNTAERMIAAIETAAGSFRFRRWIIGTRPSDSEHFFERALRGDADTSAIFASDQDGDPHDPEQWDMANPSLAAMPDLRIAIEHESEKAKSDPKRLQRFKALRLNLGTSDVLYQQLLDAEDWQRIEVSKAEQSGAYVLGVDLGGGAAMSAFARYDLSTGRLEAIAAFPSEPGLLDRGRADGVDDLYVRMSERGELIQSGKHAVDLPEILKMILKRWRAPACIVADRWKQRDLFEALDRVKFPRVPTVARGQGFKDGSEDVTCFRRACLGGYVKPIESLLLRAAMREARTVSDPARNEKLAKMSQGGRRQRARDDAVAAAILAVAVGYREREQLSRKNKQGAYRGTI